MKTYLALILITILALLPHAGIAQLNATQTQPSPTQVQACLAALPPAPKPPRPQVNGLWIAGAVLVLIHFAPNFIRMFQHPAQAPKPSAARVMAPAPAVPPIPLIDPQFSALAGTWTGRYLKPGYFCETKLELHSNALAADPFTAYTTSSCGPTDINAVPKPGHPVNWVQDFIKASTPMSAIFSGKIQGPSIQVHLTQAIGTQQYGCQPTDYTLTPFGDDQLAAKWDGTACGEGQMVMKRAPR